MDLNKVIKNKKKAGKMKLRPMQSADDIHQNSDKVEILADITVESPEKKDTIKQPLSTQITVVDHRTEKEVKVDAVKELIEKSKVSGG